MREIRIIRREVDYRLLTDDGEGNRGMASFSDAQAAFDFCQERWPEEVVSVDIQQKLALFMP